jgi:hypothetical protein
VTASGLPRIRLHDLRHTHASHQIARVNREVVSERLAHPRVAFALDIYVHVCPASKSMRRRRQRSSVVILGPDATLFVRTQKLERKGAGQTGGPGWDRTSDRAIMSRLL